MIKTLHHQRAVVSVVPSAQRRVTPRDQKDIVDSAQPLLTVIIPVYNGVATIDELLDRVSRAPYQKQIIVVDDGSSDGTIGKLEPWPIRVLSHRVNRGKGAAIRTGLGHAVGTYTIIQDADLEYDPQDYDRLLEPLLAGHADVVYGTRYLRSSSRLTEANEANGGSGFIARSEMTTLASGMEDTRTTAENESGDKSPHSKSITRWSLCRMGVSLLNRLVTWLYGVRVTDEATCYKVFRTDDLRAMDLQCERFEFCPEVTAKACRMGLRIVEVPISYTPRTVTDGKIIRWRDGWAATKTLWRWRNWQPVAFPVDLNSHPPHRGLRKSRERAARRRNLGSMGKSGQAGEPPHRRKRL